jgi:hypothetical protein
MLVGGGDTAHAATCVSYPIHKSHSDLRSERTAGGKCVISGFRREVDERELRSSGLLRTV